MNRFAALALQLVLCALFIAHLSHAVDAAQSEAREAVPAAFNSFARVPAHDCTTLVEEFRKIEANTHSQPETTCTTVAARIMRMLQGLTGAHDVSRTLRAAVVGGAACAPGQNNGCTCTRASNDDCDTQFSGGFAPGHFYLGSIETDRAQATRSPSHAFVYFVYPNGNDVAIYQAFANQHSLRTTYSTVSKVRHAFKLMIEASTNHPAASQSSSSASTFLGRAKQFIKQQTPKLKHAFGMHVAGKPFTLLQRSTLNLFDAGVQTYVDDIERIVISVGYPGTLCTANNVAPAKFTTMCNLLGYKGVPNHVTATGAGAPGKCQ